MKLLKLIAVLLDYPDEALWAHGDELRAATQDPALSPERRAALLGFVETLLASEPMAAQERWLELFDRGRSMSLLLFEHIHGESRDRGQAMVDLLSTYRGHGFELGVKQLPDYLPVVLEYLSLRPVEEVRAIDAAPDCRPRREASAQAISDQAASAFSIPFSSDQRWITVSAPASVSRSACPG